MASIKNKMREILATEPRYQTHTWRGEALNTGVRGLERRNLMRVEDFAGKRVLDLGCATGADCLWAAEHGAIAACGIDRGLDQVTTLRKLAQVARLGSVLAVHWDLGDGMPFAVKEQQWDTVLCCALSQYVGYKPIWNTVPGASVIYFESGADSRWETGQFAALGWNADLLAMVPNSNDKPEPTRQLFRLTKL